MENALVLARGEKDKQVYISPDGELKTKQEQQDRVLKMKQFITVSENHARKNGVFPPGNKKTTKVETTSTRKTVQEEESNVVGDNEDEFVN